MSRQQTQDPSWRKKTLSDENKKGRTFWVVFWYLPVRREVFDLPADSAAWETAPGSW